MAADVSELFDASEWADAAPAVTGSGGFSDITYHHSLDGRIARIAFDRPEVRNAFRPHTVDELYRALEHARINPRITHPSDAPASRNSGELPRQRATAPIAAILLSCAGRGLVTRGAQAGGRAGSLETRGARAGGRSGGRMSRQ